MGFLDVARGVTKGVAMAGGNQAAVTDIGDQQAAAEQQKKFKLQQQIAPLGLALQGLKSRLTAAADPNDPTKALPGKEAEYNLAHDNMADVIGKMRMLMYPPPKEDAHGLSYLAHRATDKMHITNHAVDDYNQSQAAKKAAYDAQTAQDVGYQVQSIPSPEPGALSAEEEHQVARVRGGLDAKEVMFRPPTVTEAERNRQDFADYQKAHPEDTTSTVNSWLAGQRTAGRVAATPKKPLKDEDEYRALEAKKLTGVPLTTEERAKMAAMDLWINKRYTQPGVARAAAGTNRYVAVYDPSDPDKNVRFMRASEAQRAGFNSPQSISFKTDTAMEKYMTSGKGGENLAFFNTAANHLQLLQQASQALKNGDIPAANKFANMYATATGGAAPTNFNAVKNAVTGELAKTFAGKGATKQEIDEISKTMNDAQSPEQIAGAVDYYTDLMGGKVGALQQQFEMGKQGKPNFGGPKTKVLQNTTGGPTDDDIIKALNGGK